MSREALADRLLKGAESIDMDFRMLYEALLPKAPPEAVRGVEKAFSKELITSVVNDLKLTAERVKIITDIRLLYRTLISKIDSYKRLVADRYCKCLCEAGVEVCKQ
jgi:hypothetical protein